MKIAACLMAVVGLTSATAIASTFATTCTKEADCSGSGDCCAKFWVLYTPDSQATIKRCMNSAQRT